MQFKEVYLNKANIIGLHLLLTFISKFVFQDRSKNYMKGILTVTDRHVL